MTLIGKTVKASPKAVLKVTSLGSVEMIQVGGSEQLFDKVFHGSLIASGSMVLRGSLIDAVGSSGSSGQVPVSQGASDIDVTPGWVWGTPTNTGGGAVSTYTNAQNDRIITSTGTSGINAEAKLTFDSQNGRFKIGDSTAKGLQYITGSSNRNESNALRLIGASQPKLLLQSLGNSGGTDPWLDQGARISLGEGGYGGAALHLTYIGNGKGYIGMGTINNSTTYSSNTSTAGVPPNSAIQFSYNSDTIVIPESTLKITSKGLAVGNITPSSTAGRIDASNDIIAFSSSDSRWKENIVTIGGALEKLSKINGVYFDWKVLSKEEKKTQHDNTGHDVGVIAQEVEVVLPEAVTTRDNGYKAVNYEKIIPLLIESIKEQQEQINQLKKQINKGRDHGNY